MRFHSSREWPDLPTAAPAPRSLPAAGRPPRRLSADRSLLRQDNASPPPAPPTQLPPCLERRNRCTTRSILERTTGSAAHSERQLSAIRAELDQQRRFRIEQLDELAVDAAEAVAAGDEPRLQVTYALRLAAESALTAIDAALRRLEEGSYGTCERCAEPIPWERLDVLPMTGLCSDCQFRAESGKCDLPRRGPTRSARTV